MLVVHGGPWARDNWGYDPEAQFLANRRFAILQINFRGSTGYGKNSPRGRPRVGRQNARRLDRWRELDLSARASPPCRIGIYGGSYGGYATLAALAFRPDAFACGVDYAGISNLLTFMKTILPYWETFRRRDVSPRR